MKIHGVYCENGKGGLYLSLMGITEVRGCYLEMNLNYATPMTRSDIIRRRMEGASMHGEWALPSGLFNPHEYVMRPCDCSPDCKVKIVRRRARWVSR